MQKTNLSAASGFSDSYTLLFGSTVPHSNDLNLDRAQLYFGGFFGFCLSLERLFKLDPWQTVVDLNPSCVGLAVAFQLRHEAIFGVDH